MPVLLLKSLLNELVPEWCLVGAGDSGLRGRNTAGDEQVFVETVLHEIPDGLVGLLEVDVALLVREGGVES